MFFVRLWFRFVSAADTDFLFRLVIQFAELSFIWCAHNTFRPLCLLLIINNRFGKKVSVVEPILFQQPLYLSRQTDIRLSTLTSGRLLVAGYIIKNASVEGVGMVFWMLRQQLIAFLLYIAFKRYFSRVWDDVTSYWHDISELTRHEKNRNTLRNHIASHF